jgi:hypothetical protein
MIYSSLVADRCQHLPTCLIACLPACLAGWFNGDVERRYANRRAHFAAISAGGAYDAYDALCKDPALFLDSYFQVSTCWRAWSRAKQL